MFTGHPSAGHEHFSAVPHVPSAFSMFGPPGYSLLRPTGTEFGGLGSLHSLTEAARLQALGLPMAGHNPLSPSTDPGANPWWQHAAAAHSMAGLGHEFYASQLGAAAASPTFGLAAAAAAAAAAGKEETSSSPGFESLLGQIKSPKVAKPSPTGSSGSKASTSTSRRARQRKPDYRPSSLSPPATSTSIPQSPPPSSLSSPKKEGVSVIREVPEDPSTSSPSSSHLPRSSASISTSSISTKTIATPTTSLSSSRKKTDQRPAASSESNSDDDDDDDIAESDSNQSDVSSGDDSGSDSDPDSDDKELANLMATKKQLEAQQREILHQKALEMLRKKQFGHSSSDKQKKSKGESSSPLELLKQKHIAHEQELREQEQKRRAAELTLHFEQQIKQQQQQLRLQKKAQADKEKTEGETSESGEKRKSSSARYSRKEERQMEKTSQDNTPIALDMSKKPRKAMDEDEQPLALNLKVNKKLFKPEFSHAQVNGKPETVSAFSSAAASPTPSSKSNATDTPAVARFRDVDSEADSEKATNEKAAESDEEESEDSDDSQEVSSDSDGDEGEEEEEEEESDSDDEPGSKAETDGDSARDSESSPVPGRVPLLTKRQLIESMIEVPDTNPRKRMRVTDDEAVRHPLDHGWRRQIVIRQLGPGDRVKGDVIYYAPCGKKLRTYPEVMRYIERRGITTVAREHFSFSAKIRVGEFLNPKPGENGIVFEKLSEEELQNRIDILCNRKPRNVRQVKAAERKRITQELARRSAMVKHQKKLEQQEMARRIAEAKMRRKMERQAHQQAQREARRQQAQLQALQMAEAKKREKDHRRILKEQEKMARMQQLRLEREMRNHQIIEEREIRRQQAVLMKHQERERRKHLLILERERRKQHMMLVRALEARKKAEEKERAKQHKKQDKRALKEKRFQQEQMELTLARELKKPVEDMKLYDENRPLPELTQMKNVRLTGSAYADCLMVIEFLHNFGETLGLDDDDIPTMGILQAGLFNDQEHIDEVITLTVQLLSMAVDDPGLPGELNTTSYGEKLDDVIVTENNMSEILRLFMTRTNGKEDELSSSLIRMPYRALSATEKASILAFLVNQLVCNQTVMQQIDIEMNKVADLRRDKWVVEGKVRKLRVLQSKKFGRKSTPKKNSSEPGTSTPKSDQSKPNMDKTPAGEDDDDDETKDGDDDDDETRDIDDDDEEDGGGEEGGAVEEEEEEDDGITVEEIQKKIERLQKQHSQFRHKIFDAHHIARATTFGQDRFKRRFWVLPHAGGIYVEGMESGDLSEQDKKNIKAEVKMEVKLEKEVKEEEEEEKEEEIKKEKDECKKEEDCDSEKKDSVEKEPQADVAGSSYVTQNGDQTASTSQEVSLQSQNNLFRTDDIERTMDKDEIERKFNRDLEGLIEMGLSADDKKPEQGTKFDEFEESMEKKDEDERKEEAKMDVAESESIATHNGLVVQNGPTDLSKHGARRTPTPTHYEQTEKDKQGHEQDTPLSLEPKREVLSPTLSKSSTPTPSKVSTPSHISTPGSSTRDVSSPSLSDTKSGFMSLDSILHRGTPQPYVLANPYAAATSAASPVISEHLLKGVDSKPNGSLGTWFSILPRMPCDDESLTRTQTSNDSSSSDQQIAAELKHNAAAMPFNVSPYGLYQMPFPLMHMNQMNPLVGAYAAFPGFGAVPLQAVAGMNGPLDLSNPMMSVVSSSSSPQPQQDVKPDIKMEIKKEDDDEDEDERESIAIAQMKSMLDKIESAAEQPIPEDLRDGWWQITSIEQLRLLMRNLQPRGIRERVLQKTLQKYVDFCEKSMKKGISDYVQIEDKEEDEDATDASSSKKKEVKSEDMVKDVVFTCNRKMVESIEEMEEKVYCASMQVKGWTLPDKVSCEPFFESYEAAETSGSNLLNISIRRLEALEKAVERRYLKPPLTRSTPRGEDDIAPGLVRWRNAVAAATSASQLCLCLGMLENCIAWDKSIMKVFCQLCRKGDNEALLLLCDGCDKGFHTYCFKPKMEKIPEGDWYCSVCVSKATGEPGTCIECQKTGKLLKCNQCPRSYHLNCLNPQLSKMPRGKWMCPPCEKIKRKAEKKKKKHKKSKHKEKEKGESGRSTPASIPGSPADTPKSETKHVSKKHKDNMAPCKQMVSELDKEENSWPFLLPVNTKQFTSYRKIIKKPMDLSTLRNKMHNGSCRTHEEFAADVRLMFDNCETYNEDESEVGQAGHAMRAFFEKRWPEVLKEYGYLVAT